MVLNTVLKHTKLHWKYFFYNVFVKMIQSDTKKTEFTSVSAH